MVVSSHEIPSRGEMICKDALLIDLEEIFVIDESSRGETNIIYNAYAMNGCHLRPPAHCWSSDACPPSSAIIIEEKLLILKKFEISEIEF